MSEAIAVLAGGTRAPAAAGSGANLQGPSGLDTGAAGDFAGSLPQQLAALLGLALSDESRAAAKEVRMPEEGGKGSPLAGADPSVMPLPLIPFMPAGVGQPDTPVARATEPNVPPGGNGPVVDRLLKAQPAGEPSLAGLGTFRKAVDSSGILGSDPLDPGPQPSARQVQGEELSLGASRASSLAELVGATDPAQPTSNNLALLQHDASVPTRPVGEPPVAMAIRLPLNHDQWGQALASRVAWQVTENIQQAQLMINPPELGPVEIHVSVNENQASVQFHTAHAAVRETLQEAIPRLREMLSGSGLSLADANVSQWSSGQDRRPLDRSLPWEAGHAREEQDSGEYRSAGLGLIDAYA